MLIIKNFTRIYSGQVRAVDNLSLTVSPGDLYAFIGHNGAGKTTLLRACAGIDPVRQGEIHVDGLSITQHPAACKQQMAYIPDNPDIYEYLTGIQYLHFIADMYGVPADQREKDISTYSEILDLTDKLGDMISSYSHGMKQKLVLISAFIHHPRLLLLDEPFVGLDPAVSFQVKELMKDFCQQGGAILFSTHVLEVAQQLANRVAIIRKGRLVASGTMEEVRGDESLEQVFLELSAHDE